jgi:hypothetical protein
VLGFLALNTACHIREAAPASVEPSFCTPRDQTTIDIFRSLKRVVNGAAQKMAVPHQIDADNPNLDENTFRLMILVARSLVEHLTEQRRVAEISALANTLAYAQAGLSPDQFELVANNIEGLLGLFQDISTGKYGKRILMTQTVVKPPTLPQGALILIGGVGFLGAALIHILTPRATKGAW